MISEGSPFVRRRALYHCKVGISSGQALHSLRFPKALAERNTRRVPFPDWTTKLVAEATMRVSWKLNRHSINIRPRCNSCKNSCRRRNARQAVPSRFSRPKLQGGVREKGGLAKLVLFRATCTSLLAPSACRNTTEHSPYKLQLIDQSRGIIHLTLCAESVKIGDVVDRSLLVPHARPCGRDSSICKPRNGTGQIGLPA